RSKKHRAPRHHTPAVSRDLGVSRSPSVPLDYDGTPIIMQGFHRSRGPRERGDDGPRREVRGPRGSSTYIVPVNPAPAAASSPPAAALTQPTVQPYKPPPINTFSDRVTNCIHSFPLQGGVGNNPSNQQMYIRQCAN